MNANQRITIRDVVNEVGISYESAETILTEELQMQWYEKRSYMTTMPPSHIVMAGQQIPAGKQTALKP
jgi:hypothetical protein